MGRRSGPCERERLAEARRALATNPAWAIQVPMCQLPRLPNEAGKQLSREWRVAGCWRAVKAASTPAVDRYLAGQGGQAGEQMRAATVDDPVLCRQPKIRGWPPATA